MARGTKNYEKAKDFKGTILKLLSYMGAYKIALVFVVIFAVLGTLFNVIGPKILSQATTELFNGLVEKINGTGGIDFAFIGKIILILVILYIVSALFSMIQSWIMVWISQKTSYRLREDISKKINRVPMKYYESNLIGDIQSRITNDIDTLGQSMTQSVTILVTSITSIIGVLVMMLSISPIITLIAVCMIPVDAIIMVLVMRRSQKHFVAQQNNLGQINGQIEESYGGHNVIKVFNREQRVVEDFDATNAKLFDSAWRSQFFSGIMMPLIMFVGNLGYVAVAISGCMMAASGIIAVGDIQAFIQYVRNLTQPMNQLAQITNLLQSMAAAAERVFEFLAEEEESPAPEHPVTLRDVKGDITFEHVKFGYSPDKIIIHDFNSVASAGQMIAIVGPTGAGKTTMVKLLMRFYDVNDGRITLDGHDIREFDRQALRGNFGMVLQDTWLYNDTIMENIRYGRLDATDEEVIAAAKSARADNFIRSLPGGYNMVINEESNNISQGQKQLLTIARAFLADHPVIILDEATSSVDTRTEQRIQKGMDELMRGRTSFVIAHRLSTIKNADVILVMKDGDIIEQGNHKDLLSANGFYAQLYNSQFEPV